MYLALKEIKHEKLRYGLMIAMILLISYLIFILTGLAMGLAGQNTQAIDSWQSKSIVLNSDANVSLRQSFLTKDEADKQDVAANSKQRALIGQAAVVVKHPGQEKISGTFIGLKPQQYINQDMKLVAGHRIDGRHQVVLDDSYRDHGYKLCQKIKFNSSAQKFKVVGFTHNAKINISPIAYGNLKDWTSIQNLAPNMAGSAIVSKKAQQKVYSSSLKSYGIKTFISKLPGYSAQNSTFIFMISFLMVISLIIIAVFLYIITAQKIPNYAVLRAQGLPASLLVRATLNQALVLTLAGLIGGAVLSWLTRLAMPSAVPISFDIPLLAGVALALVIMALLGALIPVRLVLKVDPVSVIGG